MKSSFLAVALMAFDGGCLARYSFPRPDDPHAIIKLRQVYHASAGTHLASRVLVDRQTADSRVVDAAQTAPNTQALRVHPRSAAWIISSDFHHFETRLVQESYTVQVPYTTHTTETYTCGYSSMGPYSSARTCTRPVTRTAYRTEMRTRLVNRTVAVTDAACRIEFVLAPTVGETYLLQHTYVDNRICRVVCLKQATDPGGVLGNTPCPSTEFALLVR